MKKFTVRCFSILLIFLLLVGSINLLSIQQVHAYDETNVIPEIPNTEGAWEKSEDTAQPKVPEKGLMMLSDASSNLIMNGDFEIDPKVDGNWDIYYDSDRGPVEFYWDSATYHGSSGHSVSMRATAGTGAFINEVQIEPNKHYLFQGWGKGLNITTNQGEIGSFIYLFQIDANRQRIAGTEVVLSKEGTYNWAMAEHGFTSNPAAVGFVAFLYLDGTGDVWYDDISLTVGNEVTVKQLTKVGNIYKLDYKVTDSVIHPTDPVLYITDSSNKKIAYINYDTGLVKEVSLIRFPESIAYYNEEIYVGYGGQGVIEIFDAASMELKDVIFTGEQFFDLNVGNDGYIYTSAQYYTRSYSRTTKQEFSSIWVYRSGYLETHPTLNSLYMTSVDVTPKDLYTIKYSNGKLIEQYDSPYHGDYNLSNNNKVSPDGKYIFNGSGNLFTPSEDKAQDMVYADKLSLFFGDIAFDLENDRFFIGCGSVIHGYKYSILHRNEVHPTDSQIKRLYYRDNRLIAISTAAGGADNIALIDVPYRPATGITLSKTSIKLLVDQSVKLTATITPENAANKIVLWSIVSSSGTDIINLTTSGEVVGKKTGTAVVKAMSLSDPTKYVTCTVTVATEGFGDCNRDGIVDIDDLTILAMAFGARIQDTHWDARADIRQDGVIDSLDLAILASNYEKP